ncbi:MAG: hypothetical protein IJ774_15395, partial [Selenomonadaceae bacterium]|nr:hypothetical protein [Selenomonadaceae bacterium]
MIVGHGDHFSEKFSAIISHATKLFSTNAMVLIFMTKIHPETGEILYRDIRPFEFTFRGEKITVDMTGCFGLCVTNHEG